MGGVWAFLIVWAVCGRCVGVVWAVFKGVGALWAMCGRFLREYFTVWALCGRCVGDIAVSPHFRPHISPEGTWKKPKFRLKQPPAKIHAVWFIRDTVKFGLELSLKFVRIQSSLVPYFVP